MKVRQSLIAAAVAAAVAAPSALAQTSPEALAREVEELARQVKALQAQVQKLQSQNEALANQLDAPPAVQGAAAAGAPTPATAAPAHGAIASTLPSMLSRASLFGYGEINYNRYQHDSSATQMDLRRAVFGIGYRFDENTRFVSEFEFEHAIASADDDGEVEVEQFYVDHRLASFANLKAGLFLVPSGILNESHEPPRYYGVERNSVETAIIPSTWREGGVGVYGQLPVGVRWDVGVTTGFNLAKWEFDSEEGRQSPLGAVHQELQLARAADLAQYVALNYDGVPGFNVGASVFTGGAGQAQPGVEDHPRVTLWETHTRWTPGALDLSAIYARGIIGGTGAANLANASEPSPIPDSFYGWYVQGGYRVWQSGAHSLSPFVRFERFNTGASFAGGADPLPLETVRTYGVNFYLNPNVVFKADYQDFDVHQDSDRFDLGLGLMFF